jgi:hypothetical protein
MQTIIEQDFHSVRYLPVLEVRSLRATVQRTQLYICPNIQKVSHGKNNTPNAKIRQLFYLFIKGENPVEREADSRSDGFLYKLFQNGFCLQMR